MLLSASALAAPIFGGWPKLVEAEPNIPVAIALPDGRSLEFEVLSVVLPTAQVRLGESQFAVIFGGQPVVCGNLLLNGEWLPGQVEADPLGFIGFSPGSKLRFTLWPVELPEGAFEGKLYPMVKPTYGLLGNWLAQSPEGSEEFLPAAFCGVQLVAADDLAQVMRVTSESRFLRLNTLQEHAHGLLDRIGGWSQIWLRDHQFLYCYANLGHVLGRFRLGEPLEAGRTFSYNLGSLGQGSAPIFGLYLLANGEQRDVFDTEKPLEEMYPGHFIDPRPLLRLMHQATFGVPMGEEPLVAPGQVPPGE